MMAHLNRCPRQNRKKLRARQKRRKLKAGWMTHWILVRMYLHLECSGYLFILLCVLIYEFEADVSA